MQLSLNLDDHPILPHVRALLLARYGPQRDARRHDPTSQFVNAVISGCTRDAAAAAAFIRLLHHGSSWDWLPDADPLMVAVLIRDVEYAPDKAFHLVASARIVRDRRGRFDLGFLADWTVGQAMAWLLPLPGVGWKVASAVLNFSSMRKRAIVVDRHVLRTFIRLGVLPVKAKERQGFSSLMRAAPDHWDADDLYEFHWLVKMNSQAFCHPSRPDCGRCSLAYVCTYRGGTPGR